jgi:dienelactone hydrolase
MPQADLFTFDPLSDFERRDLVSRRDPTGVRHGQRPAVIVMTEMPGIHPQVARFARWVRDAGFTVWMLHLFGDDGRPPTTLYA